MEDQVFDQLAKSVADEVSSRRSLLTRAAAAGAGLLALLTGMTLSTEAKRHAHSQKKGGGGGRGGRGGKAGKKSECVNNGDCRAPDNPCEKKVCRGGKCVKEVRQDGAECGTGLVCAGGTCVASCGGGNAPCGDGTTCCSGACVDTTTNFSNCGSCGNACNPDRASVCVTGVCQCGANRKVCGARCIALDDCCTDAECTGPDAGACVNGVCVPAFQICNLGGASSQFVTGAANPAPGASSLKLDVGNDGLDAVHVNFADFAGTLISDLEKLDYTTFVPTGGLCDFAPYIVLLVETPVPPTPEQPYDILIYDPGVDDDPAPSCNTLRTWHARNGKYRSIFHNDFAPQPHPKSLDAYDAMFGPTKLYNLSVPTDSCPNTVGGLRIEVGHGGGSVGGWQNFVGFVDSLTIKVNGQPERQFDF